MEIDKIQSKMKRVQSDQETKRPVSRYSREREFFDPQPRFHCDNIVQLELDLGERNIAVFNKIDIGL